ncbi:MAG: 4-hydroxy-tetrahydrodipicolinate synthase [Actinobacteria bacterium]|nr:4-hydroxy-tetrahydrodipicolinate synthase [Actinomycetota bacterium]MDA2984531.1 4-hydroxy-tetrahydrodipicolinate synthase [Actinomycetota bacterium]
MASAYSITPPFGRLITAMVTPFKDDLTIDMPGLEKLAAHLQASGHDGIVLNGTTGEAPTTSDDEKMEIIRAVKSATGGKVKIIAGAGNNETSHSIEQAKMAHRAGADALLVVTPYYNKPPQAGIYAHFTAMASATELPIMLYDIPGRTGVAIKGETIIALAENPKIVALKDAKGDLAATSWVIKESGIAVYSGDDILNLPFLAIGAVGFVSVCGHSVGQQLRKMIDSWFAGDIKSAQDIHHKLLPVYEGTFRTQGAILTKAALALLNLPGGKVRLPLVDATAEEIKQLRKDLIAGEVELS